MSANDTQQVLNKAGIFFKKARQEIQNPATLKRLIVELIDPEAVHAQFSSQSSKRGDNLCEEDDQANGDPPTKR